MSYTVRYPELIEDWWINLSLSQLSCNSLQNREAQLERNLHRLTDLFTTGRTRLAKDYFGDPELLCSYGLFFFPQNFARTSLILQEVVSRGWKPYGPLSILDLGSGAGAASLSAASLWNTTPVTITAVDHSGNALRAMQNLVADCTSVWPLLNCKILLADFWDWSSRQTEKWDLIFASFALNETEFSSTQATDVFANLLTEKGVVVIVEPALKLSSERLEAWRDQLTKRSDLHVWAPCLHRSDCPLLSERQYWCHEVRSWQPPASIRFLNRRLYRQIHLLKFSFLVFGKSRPHPFDSFSFRLISPVLKRKRRLMFTGCTSDGKKKDFSVSQPLIENERKYIKGWKRGDIVTSFPLNRERFSSTK